MIISTVGVLLFMLVYYRFCGLVADIGVILNLLLVIAFMIILKATFTLAGLAGLVLSVGMAVDTNVLIYERMREELAKGAALRMAIRNGFNRADVDRYRLALNNDGHRRGPLRDWDLATQRFCHNFDLGFAAQSVHSGLLRKDHFRRCRTSRLDQSCP